MSVKERIYIELLKYKNNTQLLRVLSLFIFSVLSLLIGFKFYLFVNSINSNYFYQRPAGVDAYLPISSLMNIRHFVNYSDIHMAHPAGFFILCCVLFISVLFSKSFCSWVCPFGFLSEILIFIRKVVLNREFRIPNYIDWFLRFFKYVILFFFIYVIFIAMSGSEVKEFLDSDYNKISDIKMFYFFANISKTALWVIISLIILSFLFNFFWCRYLCPYGALVSIAGLFSLFKIKRNKINCNGCRRCSFACPHYINVSNKNTVFSDYCSSCMICINSCPQKNTLELKTIAGKRIGSVFVFFIIISSFLVFKCLAVSIKRWDNNITQNEYKELILNKDNLKHPSSF